MPAAPAVPAAAPLTAARTSRRRAAAKRESVVAVRDIDDVFPSLDKTLMVMNQSQSVFGFDVIDMAVPLDVWDINRSEATNFLWAEHMARRLQDKPAELGADPRMRHAPLAARQRLVYLYGWEPEGQKPPVVLFSVAGFDELKLTKNFSKRTTAANPECLRVSDCQFSR